mmetsp:Transcript_44631/g.139968  ORF Transcript_44631/g.139968 Transcript_44631/m.139968 type:complete len:324 (-) Transcript_44631:81-1052(-)
MTASYNRFSRVVCAAGTLGLGVHDGLDNAGEVLVAEAHLHGLEHLLVGGLGRGHGVRARGLPGGDGKAHVLLGVLEREVGRVVALLQRALGALNVHEHAAHGTLRKDLNKLGLLEVELLGEVDALAEAGHEHAHHHVHAELHARGSAHVRAQVMRGLPHGLELRRGLGEGRLVAGDHKDERAGGGRALGAGHRRLEELAAGGRHGRAHALHILLLERRTVHDDLAGGHARERAHLRRVEDGGGGRRRAQHGERQAARLHHVGGARRNGDLAGELRGERVGLLRRAVPHNEVAAGLRQHAGHTGAHDAEANEAHRLAANVRHSA